MIASYSQFEHLYISSIDIDTEETFSPTSPSNESISVYKNEDDTTVKRHIVTLSPEDINEESFNNHIFYVYVTVVDSSNEDSPTETRVGVVLNWKQIYQQGIGYMKGVLKECCEMPKAFIDYILRLKAFELALRTAQYVLANDRYIRWFKEGEQKSNINCGCN